MGTGDNTGSVEEYMALNERRDQVRKRRYERIQERYLPAWTHAPIVRRHREYLLSLHSARLLERNCGNDETPNIMRGNPRWIESQIARTVRLCNYSPEMQKVWNTIETTPLFNTRFMLLDTSGSRITWWLQEIESIERHFHSLPKLTQAQRRKSFAKVISAAERLLDAIDECAEAQSLMGATLANFIGSRNLRERATRGERISVVNELLPRFAFDHGDRYGVPQDIEALEIDPAPSWSKWSAEDKFRWLHDQIQQTSLVQLLNFSLGSVCEAGNNQLPIAHPGRPDGGFLPFLIRELSARMVMLYDKPLDDSVALLASAITDRTVPLSRDDVRPVLRSTGRNSAEKMTKSSHGKKSKRTR